MPATQSIARTPLMSALPAMPTGEVIDKAFYPRLTDLGQRHPVTRGLEGSASEPPHWSRWFRLIGVDQPEGEVVMKGADNRPLLVLDRKGEGRVGMLLSDQGWLWARGFEGGGPHVALYRRIAHWLMKEPELEEERLTADGRGMMLDIRRQTMSDDPGPAQVITPSGKTLTVPLDSSAARRLHRQRRDRRDRPLPDRQWRPVRACPCRPGQRAGIRRHSLHRGPCCRPPAEATGGSVRRRRLGLHRQSRCPASCRCAARRNASGSDWIGLQTTDDSVLKSVSRVPLFGGFFGLGLLLLALGSMWYREGR